MAATLAEREVGLMDHISKVVMTDLFWQTLEKHRTHPRYREFRQAIAACIRHKVEDRGFTSNSDKPFTGNSVLKGIWHTKLSRNPDIVFFYRMSGDTLYCGMIGDHSDYSFNGRGSRKDVNLVARIAQAVERGHQSLPDWSGIRWSTPFELLDNKDLGEASLTELERLAETIQEEAQDLKLLERAHGSLDNLEEEVYGPWLQALTDANDRIAELRDVQRLQRKAEREFTDASVFVMR